MKAVIFITALSLVVAPASARKKGDIRFNTKSYDPVCWIVIDDAGTTLPADYAQCKQAVEALKLGQQEQE